MALYYYVDTTFQTPVSSLDLLKEACIFYSFESSLMQHSFKFNSSENNAKEIMNQVMRVTKTCTKFIAYMIYLLYKTSASEPIKAFLLEITLLHIKKFYICKV